MHTGLAKIDEEWVPLQATVFTRWVVAHLKGQSTVEVKDITTDLKDGIALVELAEILTGKKPTENWSKTPKSPYAKAQNCDLALKMFQQDGVQLVGMSGKDISDGNKKLTLGLIWTLILKYSIGKALTGSSTSASSALVDEKVLKTWAADRIKGYEHTDGFQPYDMSVCALLDTYYPTEMNYKSLNPEKPEENLLSACKVMHKHDIDILVYPEDLKENEIDEKTLLTQLSAIKAVVSKIDEPQVQSRSVTSQQQGKTSSYSTSQQTNTSSYSTSQQTNTSSYSSTQQNNSSSQQSSQNLSAVRDRSASLEQVPLSESPSSGLTGAIGDNSEYEGRLFGITCTMPTEEYNSLQPDPSAHHRGGSTVTLALTFVQIDQPFINPAGRKLDLALANIEYDPYQQFTFGRNEWNTVIDSKFQKGMVWDVANELDLDPPEGTEFYLFPFHGRHNQHFVYHNGHIYAKQNGQVVTYNGGDKPLVMRKLSNELKNRQTFQIHLI